MIARYRRLHQFPVVFKALTGLRQVEFETLLEDLLPRYREAARQAGERAARQRAVGGGRTPELDATNQLLLSIVWLRRYPTQEVLGYLFGVSDSALLRYLRRCLPVLEAAGRAAMSLPQPHPDHAQHQRSRRGLDEVLRDVPELAVIIDTFEQRVQRPKRSQTPQTSKASKTKPRDPYYSGKKKQHTLKSQVAVNRQDGTFVDIACSAPGPTADRKLLEQSGLLGRLPRGVGAWGDLAYLGLDTLHPQGLGATPRRKPRGAARPPQDIVYNRAFARQRVVVEHSIGRLRRYQALSQMDRHHRHGHTARVIAVAGLVNHQMRHRLSGVA